MDNIFLGALGAGFGLTLLSLLAMTRFGGRSTVRMQGFFHRYLRMLAGLARFSRLRRPVGAPVPASVPGLAPGWMWPFIVGAALIAFGAGGLAGTTTFGLQPVGAALLAVAAMLSAAALLGLGLGRTLARSERAGETTGTPLIGLTGKISLAVPADGVGQVAYVREGRRSMMPAMGLEGVAIGKDVPVVIVDVVAHVAHVEPF